MKLLLAVLLAVLPASGQTLQLAGGTSTLFQASGGIATLYLPGQTGELSAGLAGGRVVFGIADSFKLKDWTVTVGDEPLMFNFGSVGLAAPERGIEARRDWKEVTLVAFVGATGDSFQVPFLATERSRHFGSGLFAERRFARWKLDSLAVLDGSFKTGIAGATYVGARFGFAASGGILNGGLSADAIGQFLGRSYTLSAARQEYTFDGVLGSSESAQASGRWSLFTAAAALDAGNFRSAASSGFNVTAGFRLGPVSYQAAYYASDGRRFVTQTASETVGRHWRFIESIQGRSASGGLSHTGNALNFSVSPGVQFVPGRGYERTVGVQVTIKARDLAVTLASVTDPLGRTRWSAYASDWQQVGEYSPGGRQATRQRGVALRGAVQDASGRGIEGIALTVGKSTVWSDANGSFQVLVKRAGSVPLAVDLADSVAPGSWTIVSAPSTCATDERCIITVRRAE